MMDEELKYMKRLSFDYPNVDAAVRQIVSMRSLLKLPKGTEYFFSDLHGENEAFIHLLRSGSGYIREKVNSFLGDGVSEEKKNELVELIYYPVRALSRHHSAYGNDEDWMIEVIHYLVLICREVSSKYSHRRLIHTMPKTYETILNELIFLDNQDANKAAYYEEMIASSVREGIGDQLITDLCILIRRIIVDHLHIIGDIFDRGPRADKILDELMNYRHVDVQWGNHDITWIGAAHGSPICVASVVRISLSYNGFDVLEDGYGINLRPLSTFAGETYGDDPCDCFRIHQLDQNRYDPVGPSQASKMHKAIAVILLKLEGQLIQRRKEYLMSERLLLDKIDWKTGTVELGESDYRLKDTNVPTIDPDDPYRLSKKEHEVLDALISSFKHSEKLQRHIGFLVDHGGLYSRYNGNLLYHGCIPMDADGNFLKVKLKRKDGVTVIVSGKELMDELDRMIRQSLYSQNKEDLDILWYLWAGPKSPLYGKAKMATFERYLIDDPETWAEPKNAYYEWYEDEEKVKEILKEFDMDPETDHIVNGHVPVKIGENPIKAGGKLFVIDGGISKAYQSTTGIAGYTLIYDSHAIRLASHKPFRPASDRISAKMFTKTEVVERKDHRITIEETDAGAEILSSIADLEKLIELYRDGVLPQHSER